MAAGAWWLWSRGVNATLVLLIEALLLMPLIFVLERLVPFSEGWRRNIDGDGRVDVLHLLISARFFDLGVALPWAIAVALRGSLGASPWWPASLPLGLQVLLILLASELFAYSFHRAQHTVPFLWRFHKVHHCARRVYFLNGVRNHPLDVLPSGVLTSLLVALWGPGEEAVLVAGAFSAAHALLQHANMDLRLGFLRGWISGPEAHRWHHSAELSEANSNYGQVLLVYDWLFRTRLIPKDRVQPAQIGLAGGEVIEERFAAQMTAPWR